MEEGRATSVNIAPPTLEEGNSSTSPISPLPNGGTNGAPAADTPPLSEGAQVGDFCVVVLLTIVFSCIGMIYIYRMWLNVVVLTRVFSYIGMIYNYRMWSNVVVLTIVYSYIGMIYNHRMWSNVVVLTIVCSCIGMIFNYRMWLNVVV